MDGLKLLEKKIKERIKLLENDLLCDYNKKSWYRRDGFLEVLEYIEEILENE